MVFIPNVKGSFNIHCFSGKSHGYEKLFDEVQCIYLSSPRHSSFSLCCLHQQYLLVAKIKHLLPHSFSKIYSGYSSYKATSVYCT